MGTDDRIENSFYFSFGVFEKLDPSPVPNVAGSEIHTIVTYDQGGEIGLPMTREGRYGILSMNMTMNTVHLNTSSVGCTRLELPIITLFTYLFLTPHRRG